jgi:GT2 family glycosyltransferase
MAYINRKPQLITTLCSIQASEYPSKEVVIVDDGSDDSHQISLAELSRFTYRIRLVLTKRNAFGANPCVLYNLGFKHTMGETIIIQNPENVHYGDVFSRVHDLTQENRYLLFSARTLNLVCSLHIQSLNHIDALTKPLIRSCLSEGTNDEQFFAKFEKRRPELHWCAAIRRADLKQLNGFDERFANGTEYDDDEFFLRVCRKNMEVMFLDDSNPMVFHQYHPPVQAGHDYVILSRTNRELWRSIQSETDFRANPGTNILV